MKRQEFHTAAAHAGRRIDSVLASLVAGVPHAELCRWLRKGFVRANGRRLKADDRLQAGDVLALPCWAHQGPASDASDAAARTPQLPPPDLRYQDAHLLVAYKPEGLASHPGMAHDHDSLSARLAAHVPTAAGCRVGLAQRLDAGVSGLIPCGTHPAGLKALMGPPHGPAIIKLYVALVVGQVQGGSGHIRLPLRNTDQPRGDAPKAVVDRIAGVPAHTEYTVVRSRPDRSLLVLRLHTGRTHQIRAHLRAIGHPIVGDPRYGFAVDNARFWQTHGVARPLLHAGWLRVPHPIELASYVECEAPVPRDFLRAAQGLCAPHGLCVDAASRAALSVPAPVGAALSHPRT